MAVATTETPLTSSGVPPRTCTDDEMASPNRKPTRGRPPLPKGERRVRIDVRLRPETVRELARMAADARLTKTEVLERLIGLCCPGYACWVCGSHSVSTPPSSARTGAVARQR